MGRLAKPVCVQHIDTKMMCLKDAEHVESDFRFKIDASAEEDGTAKVHGLVVYFDVVFTGPGGPDLILTTAPAEKGSDKETHWAQVRMFFSKIYAVKTDDRIKGKIQFCKNRFNQRSFDIAVTDLRQKMVEGDTLPPVKQYWHFEPHE